MSRTLLEQEVSELRQRLAVLEERTRLDSVAEAFIAGVHEIREGDFFLLDARTPTRLANVSSGGRWSYYDENHRFIEPYRIPAHDEYQRLYTIAEVAEIVAKVEGRD